MKDGILHLDLNTSRKHPQTVKLTDICDSIVYIALETKKECLIEHINHVEIDGDHIFLQDGWKVYHFDITGKFLGQLGKTGRGPGEYICAGFCLDKQHNKVFVLTTYRKKIYEFNYENEYISDRLRYKGNLASIRYGAKEKTIAANSWYLFSRKDKNPYNLLSEIDCIKKTQTDYPSKYFPDRFFKNNTQVRFNTIGSTIYTYKGLIHYQDLANDTIFRKENGATKTHIILNNKDYVKPFDSNIDFSTKAKENGSLAKRFYTNVMGESSRYIFCRSWFTKYSFIYDKQEKELICNNIKGNKAPLLRNDMDGIFDFNKYSINSNTHLLTYLRAERILEEKYRLEDKASIYTKQIQEIGKHITEESNPVIMIARLKK